ncbi:hypothetical protein NKR23_g10799 [Pleurostoma richardsiae]|uniref:Zn(2)-C6 fungal-type domain-containing protein n=1 Tax=Pleurostoma richardsiae TaxID=41990 RepID=A0AA38R4N2_9PEZI|nr:hypothetical protein NKR23_g10799 [Pleurostoma richardsiae]
MASPDASECSICRLPFAHASPIRRNACPFCNRTFGRVDGARRHTRSCPAKGDRPLPPDAKRGRKVRACDACSRIKVSCNAKLPCQRCSSRSLACTYGRLCTDPAHLGGSSRDKERLQPSGSLSALRFLLNCSDPRFNFINDVLAAGEPERDLATPAPWDQSSVNSAGNGTIDPQLLFLGFMDPYLGMSLDYDGMYDDGRCSEYLTLTLSATPNDGLEAQVHRLEVDLQQLIDGQSDFSDVGHQDSFKQFFTCANFHRLLTIFFRRRQLLARIVHWPTFDPSKVELSLLLAIALCGAAYSHRSAESLKYTPIVGTLQQLAEKYIFRRLKHCPGPSVSRLALEVCQAAYLIVVLQVSVNDSDTRRRSANKRQPALVDALRRRGMLSTKLCSPTLPADWQAFVHRESWIRLTTCVFFTDALMALLCNSPPATTVSEMSGDLPCPDELWDANCSSSFEAERNRGELVLQSPCVKDFLTDLLEDEWTDAMTAIYQRLTVWHLYSGIGVFQFVLFNYRTNMLPKSFASVLLRALDRWDRLWAVAMDRVAPDQQGWLGVSKYAPEFALISRRIIEASITEEGRCSKYLQCTAEFDLQVFHEFILQHGAPITTATAKRNLAGQE